MNRNDRRHAAPYHGLRNQGSTCYLNSVLQVLFMTKEFRNAVNGCSTNCENIDYIDPLLKSLFKALERSTAKTTLITKKLGITVNEQRDAAEYFEKILNDTNPEASQVFQGQLTHKNTCTGCGNPTNTCDPFWSLPLRLEPNKEYNVEKGIENFFQDLHICGENQMYCEICDAKTDATIKLEMTHHPEVLTLLLKRFKFDYHHQEYVKIKQTVTVPDTLQIPESQIYELYAFVEHFGELRSGHYTVSIKSQDDGRWYNFNDTHVTLLQNQPFRKESNHKSSSAYLLFYKKPKTLAAEALNQNISEDFTAGAPNSEQCEPPLKYGESHEDEEEADTQHSHADNSYKKEVMNAREDKDGETRSSEQVNRKMHSTKNSNKELVEYGDNKTDVQITQKRKGDSQESGQEIPEKSKRSGCPKQIKQSPNSHLRNDAEDQQDKMSGNVKHKPYSDNQDKLHEGDQYERMSQSRDKTDRSKTTGGNKDTVMHNDPSYNMFHSVEMAEGKQNLLNNNQDEKKKEKTKRDGEHAQRQIYTKRHCGESGKDQGNELSDDDSRSRLQQNQRHTQMSGSKALTGNQQRSTGGVQSNGKVIQSDNRQRNVGEDGMGGIGSVNKVHMINTQSSIKAKTQETARELNYKECKSSKGELTTSQNLSLNVSPSQEPQEQSNKNDAERIENCHEENSSAQDNARKVAKESERKQSDREKQNASDKKGKRKEKKQWRKLMSCGLCVSGKK